MDDEVSARLAAKKPGAGPIIAALPAIYSTITGEEASQSGQNAGYIHCPVCFPRTA
jgi:hypothetical protein